MHKYLLITMSTLLLKLEEGHNRTRTLRMCRPLAAEVRQGGRWSVIIPQNNDVQVLDDGSHLTADAWVPLHQAEQVYNAEDYQFVREVLEAHGLLPASAKTPAAKPAAPVEEPAVVAVTEEPAPVTGSLPPKKKK